MSVRKNKRLSQIARELNVGLSHLAEYLQKKGFDVSSRPNTKINIECYNLLLNNFSSDKFAKEESNKLSRKKNLVKDTIKTKPDKSNKDKLIEEITETLIINDANVKNSRPIKKNLIKSGINDIKKKIADVKSNIVNSKQEKKIVKKEPEVIDIESKIVNVVKPEIINIESKKDIIDVVSPIISIKSDIVELESDVGNIESNTNDSKHETNNIKPKIDDIIKKELIIDNKDVDIKHSETKEIEINKDKIKSEFSDKEELVIKKEVSENKNKQILEIEVENKNKIEILENLDKNKIVEEQTKTTLPKNTEAKDIKKIKTKKPQETDKKNIKNSEVKQNNDNIITTKKVILLKENDTKDNTTDSGKNKQSKDDIKIVGKMTLKSTDKMVRVERKKTRSERRRERRKREQSVFDATRKAKLKKTKEREISKEKEIAEQKKKLAIEKKRIAIEKAKELEDKNFIRTKVSKLAGPVVVGRIELKKEKSEKEKLKEIAKRPRRKRKRRKRIRKPISAKVVKTTPTNVKPKPNEKAKPNVNAKPKPKPRPRAKPKRWSNNRNRPKRATVINEADIKKQVRETLAKLTDKKKKSAVRHRKQKRVDVRQKIKKETDRIEKEKKILKLTEYISANELAIMMDISINEIIKTSFELGKMITINSRIDAELISIIAEEYGFEVEYILTDEDDVIEKIIDKEEDLISRPPIVTVMGHVDHGKTSLLDYIRKTNVIAGEAGGITQHIGAYCVNVNENDRITFLDTPGHKAFTSMRARGAKVTDLVIIIIAADDSIMPQTEESISHAKAADVPIIFAINKIDKPGADPERIKKELADRNMLVEEWGGDYQSKDISAKKGLHIEDLLEEVLIAAEMLELKANPNRTAHGTVIEASLDKGKGYISTVLVQTGTLKVGDVILAGANSGKIKAMYNEKNQRIKSASPSEPVTVLGLSGAPQAGDRFNVMKNDREARDLANRRQRILREQSFRSHKHITLEEIGRRLKIGNFQELNIIIKGDVIGSIEAIADSLIKLSTEEIQIVVRHKAVGQISEADVVLAAASNAIIIAFQVRSVLSAKKLAEKEEIEIRQYSVIYDAINDIKDAMEGMLAPEIKEKINAIVEIKEIFKISKVGKVAGCFVLEGKINKDANVRLIRDGIVKYTGKLGSLKRYKDEVKEVASGMECGLNIKKYDDIKVGDIIEAYTETEIARKLK